MKKKTLSLLLSGLLTVSLTGVGFAAWYITANTETSASGDISVEEVKDARVGLETSVTDANVHFGADKGQLQDSDCWLKNNGTDGEDLEFSFDLTVTNTTYLTSVEISFAVHEEFNDSGVKTTNNAATFAAASNYVVAPDLDPDTTGVQSTVTFSKSDIALWTNGKKTFNLNFTWGSAFNYKNPYQYYNSQTYSATLGSQADTALKAIYALNGLQFDIKVKANVNV